MILRAVPAVASATGRATLAGQVDGDGSDEMGYPGPPGWWLGVRLTKSPCKKKLTVTKPCNKPRNVMNTRRRQRTTDLTFGTWNLRRMGINEWKDRARDRDAWRRIVKEAKAHAGL